MNAISVRIEKLLKASPEQCQQIDDILSGKITASASSAPLLLSKVEAANLAGISKSTLWRLCAEGIIPVVEIRRGVFRIRRTDIEDYARNGIHLRDKREAA